MLQVQIYLIGALILSLIVAIFAIQNTTMVTIQLLLWKIDISLVLVIIGAMAIGALAIFILGSFKNLTWWRKLKELEEKNKQLTSKINELEVTLASKEQDQNINIPNTQQQEQSEQQ